MTAANRHDASLPLLLASFVPIAVWFLFCLPATALAAEPSNIGQLQDEISTLEKKLSETVSSSNSSETQRRLTNELRVKKERLEYLQKNLEASHRKFSLSDLYDEAEKILCDYSIDDSDGLRSRFPKLFLSQFGHRTISLQVTIDKAYGGRLTAYTKKQVTGTRCLVTRRACGYYAPSDRTPEWGIGINVVLLDSDQLNYKKRGEGDVIIIEGALTSVDADKAWDTDDQCMWHYSLGFEMKDAVIQ